MRQHPPPGRCAAWVALALLPVACDAYAHMSSQYNVNWRFAWSMPTDSMDDAGLGGGITYAFERQGLCERLLPRFREQSNSTWAAIVNLGVVFVDCDEIYDALTRAFGTWASNHKILQFKDVTAQCERMGVPAADCPHAEVAVDAQIAQTEKQQAMVAYVIDRPQRGKSFTSRPPGRRTTAGEFVAADASIGYSTMIFMTQHCWYLDNTFCAPLHALSEYEDLFVRLGLFVLWAIGVLMLGCWVASTARYVCKAVRERGDDLDADDDASAAGGGAARRRSRLSGLCGLCGCVRRYCSCVTAACTGFLDALERLSLLAATLTILLIASPPVTYVRSPSPARGRLLLRSTLCRARACTAAHHPLRTTFL